MGPKTIIVQRTLYDIRDQKSYTIAKLPDGNCWMTQNLSLGSTTGSMTLTSSDSNVSSSFVLPQAQATSDTSTSWGDAANTSNTPHLYATGNDSYGNYYNWYAATAGTGTSDGVNASTDATNDICPKGWRLPDGGQSATTSFFALDKALGGDGSNRRDASQRDKFIAAPYSFPYSGYYLYAGGVTHQGSYGHWWSRSASTTAGQAHNFNMGTDNHVGPQNSSSVGYGWSVRCIASNQDFWSISTMQEMTPEIVSSVVTPSTTAASAVTNATDYANTYDKTSVVPERVLTDARDGETYRVRKLADGNVWMTENLRLTLTEGQAIEISDGSMWLPTNYDGTTTNSTTLTISDYDILPSVWSNTSNTQSDIEIVRSFSTKDMAGQYKCNGTVKTRGTNLCYETINTADGESQRVGTFYNIYTLTAGQRKVESTDIATVSICPRNWVIPSIDTNTAVSYGGLINSAYGLTYGKSGDGTKARSFPLSFIVSGYYITDTGASVFNQNGLARYYTSTPNGVSQFTFDVQSTTINRTSAERARMGLPVRCAISGL